MTTEYQTVSLPKTLVAQIKSFVARQDNSYVGTADFVKAACRKQLEARECT